MQQFSFDFRDPVFDVDGWRLSCQVISFENTYGLPPSASVRRRGDVETIVADRLTWAGGQRDASGTARIDARNTGDGIEVTVAASMPERIRCTKLIVSGLPDGELLGHRWSRQAVTRGGTTVHYPSTTHTALAFLNLGDGEHLYFESLDERVRAKRFAFVRRDDGVAVELIHEDAAYEMSGETHTPPWRIGRTRDPEAIVRRHDTHVARAFGIEPWETRADVPPWAREVSLVVALHGMHWSGYTFNTYDDMAAALDFIAARVEGRRVLAFLQGWEGRYYWQYGDYRPEPALGGPGAYPGHRPGRRANAWKIPRC